MAFQALQSGSLSQPDFIEGIEGLNDQNYTIVLEAFDRMSAANKAQRQAWRIIERAEP
jgi:hypothetical protein